MPGTHTLKRVLGVDQVNDIYSREIQTMETDGADCTRDHISPFPCLPTTQQDRAKGQTCHGNWIAVESMLDDPL